MNGMRKTIQEPHATSNTTSDAPRTEAMVGKDGGYNSGHAVEETVRRRIETDPKYAFYFSEVSCESADGVLKVSGRVPTDRLKHVLWQLIGDLEGIADVDDQLDVVSSNGLSSIHPSQS